MIAYLVISYNAGLMLMIGFVIDDGILARFDRDEAVTLAVVVFITSPLLLPLAGIATIVEIVWGLLWLERRISAGSRKLYRRRWPARIELPKAVVKDRVTQ